MRKPKPIDTNKLDKPAAYNPNVLDDTKGDTPQYRQKKKTKKPVNRPT